MEFYVFSVLGCSNVFFVPFLFVSHCACFHLFQIVSYENDVGILKSQVWEIGDKLLMTEREKKKLEGELSKQQIFLQSIGKQVITIVVEFLAEDMVYS
jgi:hypothetical protein